MEIGLSLSLTSPKGVGVPTNALRIDGVPVLINGNYILIGS